MIFSTRATDPPGYDGIRDWLAAHGLDGLVDEVTAIKPPAVAYIDDRAVVFRRDLVPSAAWTRAKLGLLDLLRADSRWVEPA